MLSNVDGSGKSVAQFKEEIHFYFVVPSLSPFGQGYSSTVVVPSSVQYVRGSVNEKMRSGPRFNNQQRAELRKAYEINKYLTSKERQSLARAIGVSVERIVNWFTAQRYSQKRKAKQVQQSKDTIHIKSRDL